MPSAFHSPRRLEDAVSWRRAASRDGLFDRFFAAPGRRWAMAAFDLKPGERVLLVGIGTGVDLPLLPEGAQAIGIDFSSDMLGVQQNPRLMQAGGC